MRPGGRSTRPHLANAWRSVSLGEGYLDATDQVGADVVDEGRERGQRGEENDIDCTDQRRRPDHATSRDLEGAGGRGAAAGVDDVAQAAVDRIEHVHRV